MRDSDLQFFLFIAIVAIIFLNVKYYRLQSQMNQRVQQQVDAWRSRELDAARSQLRQAAQAEAGVALERWRIEKEETIRVDAIRRSSAVISGKVTEHLAPYMVTFPYNPKDARFLGTPVDLIVFDGMNEDTLREIIFLEVKSRSSSLTTRERQIRDAVVARRVAWKEFRVGDV